MANDELLHQARLAAGRAHVPHSGFHVGAAIETTDGQIVWGCNVESDSYGLTICAERTALVAAIAAGKTPKTLAVCCADAAADAPIGTRTPCGACRQVIYDLCGPDITVVVDGAGTYTAAELLPDAFTLRNTTAADSRASQ